MVFELNGQIINKIRKIYKKVILNNDFYAFECSVYINVILFYIFISIAT